MKHLNLSISKSCGDRSLRFTSALQLAALIVLVASNLSFCQTSSHAVSGIVKDEKGDPMAGVSIYLKGTTKGTTTDPDGRFTFPRQLDAGERLTFSFIGYESIDYVAQGSVDENVVINMTVDVIVWGDVGTDDVYKTKPGLRRFFKKLF